MFATVVIAKDFFIILKYEEMLKLLKQKSVQAFRALEILWRIHSH